MQLHLRTLDSEVEFAFRDMCAREGIPMNQRVAQLIEADVKRYKKGRKGKDDEEASTGRSTS